MLSREEIIAADPDTFKEGRPMNVEVMTRSLLDIKAILDKAKLRFWLWFGTFAGIYRTGALLPWDGDSDLAMFIEEAIGLAELEGAFKERGFMLSSSLIYREHEHTDIAIFYPYPYNWGKRVAGPLEVDVTAFEKLNTIEFMGQQWRILSDPEKWLTYLYGPKVLDNDWIKSPEDYGSHQLFIRQQLGTPGMPHGVTGNIQDHGERISIRQYHVPGTSIRGVYWLYDNIVIMSVHYPQVGDRFDELG